MFILIFLVVFMVGCFIDVPTWLFVVSGVLAALNLFGVLISSK